MSSEAKTSAEAKTSSSAPDPKPGTHPVGTGHTGITIHWGQVTGEEDNDEVLREKWYGDIGSLGIADQMIATDGHVRASMETISNPLTQAIWGARAAKGKDAYEEHARFAQHVLFKTVSLDRYLRQAVDYLGKGYTLFEITTDIVDIPAELFPLHPSPAVNGKKKALAITGLEPRLPRTVKQWVMDPSAPMRVKAIEQWIPSDDQTNGFNGSSSPANAIRPPAKTSGYKRLDFVRADGTPAVIRHTLDQRGNNPEGLARLRSIYFSWKSKRALRILDAVRHERQNNGTPTITLPAGFTKDDELKAAEILKALRGHERAFIVLPNGYTFEWNTSGSGGGTNVQQAIEYCDREIWMNVHAPFMLLGGNGDTGSYSLADTINDVRLLGLEGHVKLICEPWNVGLDGPAIIPWLIRSNYGEQSLYPELCALNLPTRDWSKILPVVLDAINAGAITIDDPLEDFIRQVTSLPLRDPATARKKPEPKPVAAAPKNEEAVHAA